MAEFTLYHSADPEALLRKAAEPFCASGRPAEPLPLLAVRQGGIRDQVQERAADAGCVGWVGQPLVVFAELPALIAGELAPLSALERRVLLQGLVERSKLHALARAGRQRGFIDSLDRLFGDLVAERVAPDDFGRHLAAAEPDKWEGARDCDLVALYAAYLAALHELPPQHGMTRIDGRDDRTLAAEAIAERPDQVACRLRRPFGDARAQRTISIYGLNDLRRGWDRLLDALRSAPFVDELRVYLLLENVRAASAAQLDAAEPEMEELGEHELPAALLARGPDRVIALEPVERPSALVHLRDTLFRANASEAVRSAEDRVHAVAAPDMAREVEHVAREVKRLIIERRVPPHRIAVVSRKSRPYGERMVQSLRRLGVPVSARLRSNLTEVSAVAALLRVFAAAANGFQWRTLAELAESAYFDLELDAGILKHASSRGRYATLEQWETALAGIAAVAALEINEEDYRGPDLVRAQRALESFKAFRATAEELTRSRLLSDWIALALRCLGRDPSGGRATGIREGLWGLCRNACRPPVSEDDPLAVDATRTDTEGLECLAALLAEWRGSLPLGSEDERLSPGAWYAELYDALDDTEIALSTPHRRGVQVLEASAAVWRTFDHLFLVGMSAGDFPAEPSHRDFFGEHGRASLYEAGLPLEPSRVWFAREASLFRALVNGARESLTLSYAYGDHQGSPQIPSAYFDDVVSRFAETDAGGGSWVGTIPGSRIAPDELAHVWCASDLHLFAARRWSSANGGDRSQAEQGLAHLAADTEHRDLVEHVLHAAGAEHERRGMRRNPPEERHLCARPWNGGVGDPELLVELRHRFSDQRVWSASQLEEYGRCPFAFFGRYALELRPIEEPDEDMDGATRGAVLHQCLERVHRALVAEFGETALTSESLGRARKLIATFVPQVLGELAKLGRAGLPELGAYRERELCATLEAYLRWEVRENEKTKQATTPRRRPVLFEFEFGTDGRPAVTLQRGGRLLRLRGKIDRVDELLDGASRGWRYVVDHKSGASSLDPVRLYDDGAILQLPLYLLALERLEEQGNGVWGGAYQIVKDPCKRVAGLHPRSLSGGGIREGVTKTEQEAASRIHDALDLALMHVDGIRQGSFPARIPGCTKHCPSYCDFQDACREDRIRR